jgi:hypothetical protein
LLESRGFTGVSSPFWVIRIRRGRDFNHSHNPFQCDSPAFLEGDYGKPSLVLAISKLTVAGEQVGFTLEQIIELLNDGLRAPVKNHN